MIDILFYQGAVRRKVVGAATMFHTPRVGESVEFVNNSGENRVYHVVRVVYLCPDLDYEVDAPCTQAKIMVE